MPDTSVTIRSRATNIWFYDAALGKPVRGWIKRVCGTMPDDRVCYLVKRKTNQGGESMVAPEAAFDTEDEVWQDRAGRTLSR